MAEITFWPPSNGKEIMAEITQVTTWKPSWWESFILGTALSLLTLLASKITNATELLALQAAVDFLQKLLAGNVSTA